MNVVMQLRDKVKESAQQAEESHREAAALRAEREELYSEVAAAAARDDDQRSLLSAISSAAQRSEHAKLLHAQPVSAALQRATRPAEAPSMAEADGTEAPPMPSAKAAIATSQLSDAEIVSLVSLTAAKTDLKVSELRLRRRVVDLEELARSRARIVSYALAVVVEVVE